MKTLTIKRLLAVTMTGMILAGSTTAALAAETDTNQTQTVQTQPTAEEPTVDGTDTTPDTTQADTSDSDLSADSSKTDSTKTKTAAQKRAAQKAAALKKFKKKQPSFKKVKSTASRHASNRKITITYTKVSGADGYQIAYSKNYDMDGARTKKTTKNKITLRGLSEYVYFIRVRAYKKTANGKVYSKWSVRKAAKSAKCSASPNNTTATALLKSVKNEDKRQALQYALARAGHPYSQSRRNSGYYYDCSSFAYFSYKSAGVKIGTSGYYTAASEAYRLRHKRVSKKNLKPGDLVFYRFGHNGRYKNISHVAIYAGNGYIIEAGNRRTGVIFRKMYCRGNIVMAADPTK